jgi:hypothetical protein
MDCYVYLEDISPGKFFHAIDNEVPEGYHHLSRAIERCASRHLKGPKSKFSFRLYIIGHGKTRAKTREDLVPIYSTTCGMQEIDSERTAIVIDRHIDYDFAKCPLNGGCTRCR